MRIEKVIKKEVKEMKPTRTINKIHFDDLDPRRFEDFSLAIVYRLNRWHDIRHYGRSGSDDGIDIEAIQELENGLHKAWFIQCKRYIKMTKSDFKSIIDVILNKTSIIPDVILAVVSCDVSKINSDYFRDYAAQNGIKNALIWSSSIIETKLYSEHHDLLFSYFGVSLSANKRNRIATVRRNIKLKQQMRKDFIKLKIDPNETLKRPYKKFEHSEIIVRSIDDFLYPGIDDEAVGISSWFKVEMYNFYHNGIEVILSIKGVLINDDDEWDIVESNDQQRKDKYRSYKSFEIGRIPYENIIDYELDGDEYYKCPHVYVDFSNNGMPYEDIVYSLISHENDPGYSYDFRLNNKNRTILK